MTIAHFKEYYGDVLKQIFSYPAHFDSYLERMVYLLDKAELKEWYYFTLLIDDYRRGESKYVTFKRIVKQMKRLGDKYETNSKEI